VQKLLASTAILVLTAGLAAAEPALSGDARMGVISDFGGDNTGFTSRARVKFTLTGITDGGISFGAEFRADEAEPAEIGDAGEVYIAGVFGKLTMGDIDSAAEQAVGQVSGVGLTGLGDLNEVAYNAEGNEPATPRLSYEYSRGAWTGYVSMVDPIADTERYAVGLKFATDLYSVSLGYEDVETGFSQVLIGGSIIAGPVTGKLVYGDTEDAGDGGQLAVSVDYAVGSLTLTGFAMQAFNSTDRYGLGASYDLGGGASVIGGYVKDNGTGKDAMDLGVSFNF
jgi:outer membrane protein OmpU